MRGAYGAVNNFPKEATSMGEWLDAIQLVRMSRPHSRHPSLHSKPSPATENRIDLSCSAAIQEGNGGDECGTVAGHEFDESPRARAN